MPTRILVVDDEPPIIQMLSYNLRQAQYEVLVAEDGEQALNLARQQQPDLIILDVMLPKIDGLEVCRILRRECDVPIIMLTARDDEIDRVVGLELGADDYVVKPFSVRELMLRVRALLRRSQRDGPEAEEVSFGRLRLDAGGHRAWVDDEETVLTALELRLLTTLLQRRGRVQTRECLLRDVWGIEADITTRTVDTHVKRLRQKLGPAGEYVETLRGVGYRFRQSPAGSDD
jgi:two-component system phosphate regulon response regulator PhoB